MTAHISTKGHVVHQALHDISVQRAALRVERGRSVLSSGNDLGDHRIIKNTDLAAVLDGRVDPDVALVEKLDRRGRVRVGGQRPRRGHEASSGILSIYSRFDRPADGRHAAH